MVQNIHKDNVTQSKETLDSRIQIKQKVFTVHFVFAETLALKF